MTSDGTKSTPHILSTSFSPDIYKKVQDVISKLSVTLDEGNDQSKVLSLHPVVVVLPTVNNVLLLLQVNDDGMNEFMVWAKDK